MKGKANSPSIWVVKLGGSLLDFAGLPALIRILASSQHSLVIVPGGGTFADTVRNTQKRWGFSDEIAHHMALLAMEQNALLLSALDSRLEPCPNLQLMKQTLAAGKVPVWLPSQMVLTAKDIKPDWTVTSDSLSVWLTEELSAKGLLLVKSCSLTSGRITAAQLGREGVVDQAFSTLVAKVDYPVWILQRENYRQIDTLLAGREADALQLIPG